jgi:hypothetical protein
VGAILFLPPPGGIVGNYPVERNQMYNVVSIPSNKLEPVDNMSDLSHAVYQLFPDAFVDIENESNMIVIYTGLRYNNFDGTLK